jgi:beta-glucosidase
MDRRNFLRITSFLGASALLPALPSKLAAMLMPDPGFTKAAFGADFKWGVAAAAYQIEGAWNADGKSPSVWDHFTQHKKHKIKTKENGNIACDFYNRYEGDIALVKEMNFNVFRFSTAWSRILPDGTGKVNQKGLDFYHRVIDSCLKTGVEPWITLYHWDIPQILQKKGGWANREVINWFSEYADLVTRTYGDKVKNWMVLNEPMAYTALGYLIGMHAPGKIAPNQFLKAAHHTTIVQAEGGRIIRKNVPGANIGTTFSCSQVSPTSEKEGSKKAAHRMNSFLNRLYIEPLLGMGYPTDDFPFLKKIERHIHPNDMDKVSFDFDFIGLQNYTQVVTKKAALIPFLGANQVKPQKRGVQPENITDMGWEVYPEGIYNIIKQFAAYKNIPPIIITENGAAFPDSVTAEGKIHDSKRIEFFKKYLENVLKAKKEGVDIRGYFVWTLMDNFEWAEGYKPRFGLVHVDFETQQRRIKDSGLWFKEFLK